MLRRLIPALLAGAALLLGVSTPMALATPRPDAGGAGSRDTTFGVEGALRIAVPNGVRARQVIQDSTGTSWMLMGGRGDTRLARATADGRLLSWGSTTVIRLPGAEPVAMSIAEDDSARVLAMTSRRSLVLMTVTSDGRVARASVPTASDSWPGTPTLTDAVWTPQGIAAVGFVPTGPPQPVIAAITDRQLRWVPLNQPGEWGALTSVAQSAPGVFVATGRGGYEPSGERGYPLVSFGLDLAITPGTEGGILDDPREHCQFAMADIVATAQFNTIAGSTWGCDEFPETSQVVVAQQWPSLLSHEQFGAIPPRQGEGAIRILPMPGLDWHGSSLAIDSQGRFIVAGTAVSTAAGSAWDGSPALTTPRPFSARVLASGVADQTFALNSLALINSRWSWTIEDVAVDPSDRPLLLGTATTGEQTEVRLVRLNG